MTLRILHKGDIVHLLVFPITIIRAISHVVISSVSMEILAQFWHGHKSIQDSLADIQEHLPISHLLCLQLQWTTFNTLSGAGFLVIHVTFNSRSSTCHPLPIGEWADIIPLRKCLIIAGSLPFAVLVQGVTCRGH